MGEILSKPWRNPSDLTLELDEKLRKEVVDIQKDRKLKRKPNILVLGPVGTGKSSFINSVISACRGRIAKETKVRELKTSCTRQYAQAAATDPSIDFVMFDTFGVAEKSSRGFNVNDVVSVIKGHVRPGYTFKEDESITPDNKTYYITDPKKEDQIHCVVFLLSAYDVHRGYLSDVYKDKLKDLQKKVEELEIPFLVVLTKCDLIYGDIKKIFKSRDVYKVTEAARKIFEVQENDVYPLKNYNTEIMSDPMVNIPILLALKQILYHAYDYQDRHDRVN
ncbi:interferon-induced protein 44-like [Mercenaria mercenaria]|uniref:interferon-induced protein 44-like n=1 Tax=Mercenaria mercenaria TaxID=6596 RepID=UPI00234F399B|nr:interferon-induced protein 44-like [Mercenaria mercenaria]